MSVKECLGAHPNARELLVVVAAALIDGDGRVLVQQRPPNKPMADLWEFPGGKIDAGESPEQALRRELNEELGLTIDQSCLAPAVFASEALGDRHLILLLYVLRKWPGVPEARHATALKWLRPVELHRLDMPPADRPLIGLLEALI